MDPVTAARQCANSGGIDLDSQAGATILEYSHQYPKMPGWAVVAQILCDEVARMERGWRSDQRLMRGALQLISEANVMPDSTALIAAADRFDAAHNLKT